MENLIYSALIQLEKNNPDLYLLIKKAKISLEDNSKVTAYATITKEGFKIGLGREFIKDFDSFNLAALIEHESLHIVFGHLTREVFKGLSRQDRDLANIAMDSIINELGEFLSQKPKLNQTLKSGVFIETIRKMLDRTDISHLSHSSLDIFNLLKGLKEDQKEQLKNQAFDSHLQDSQDNPDMTQAETEKLMTELLENNESLKQIESLLTSGKRKGSKESGLILTGLLKARKEKAFSKAINHFVASVSNSDKKESWKRLSRRIENSKGKIKEKTQKILLGLDTSGSMLDEETIKKMKKIVSAALLNDFSVDLVFGDTRKVGEFKDIKQSFDFSKIIGGGGTDLRFIFNESLTQYDGLIVLTDGEFSHKDINSKKSKTLFLLTYEGQKNQIESKGYKTILI